MTRGHDRRLRKLEDANPDDVWCGPDLRYIGISEDEQEFDAETFGEHRRAEFEANKLAIEQADEELDNSIYELAAMLADERGVSTEEPLSQAAKMCLFDAACEILGDARDAAGWTWIRFRETDQELIELSGARLVPTLPPQEPAPETQPEMPPSLPLPNGLKELLPPLTEEDYDDD